MNKDDLNPGIRFLGSSYQCKNTHPKFSTLAKAVFVALILMCGSKANAQMNAEDVEFLKILVGWDFSGMTAEEEQAARMIMAPQSYNEQIERSKTPEQKAEDAKASLAITNPTLYAQTYPVFKTPAQLQAETEARFAITNPAIHQERLRLQKTKAQLDADEFSVWAITHPKEFTQMVRPLKTSEDFVKEDKAAYDITNPQMRPAPVFQLVPVPKPGKN